ncbi:MAG: hypothetical protein ACPGF7_05970 [Pontibacterium sp.]
METNTLVLRCLAEKKGDFWQAFCLDLNLAVQAGTLEEVRTKLHEQIYWYVEDSLVGEDKDHADQLLRRKAPAGIWLKYYRYKFMDRLIHAKNGIHQLFSEVLPIQLSKI